MNFASKELSQKLVKMGCKSESDFNWVCYYPNVDRIICKYCCDHRGEFDSLSPAFCLEDFVGCSDQAKENAKIVWGHWPTCLKCGGTRCLDADEEKPAWEYHRHEIIDSEDPWKFLEETMKK